MLNLLAILGVVVAILFVVAAEREMKYRKEGNPRKVLWKKVMYVSGILSVLLIYIAAFLLQ